MMEHPDFSICQRVLSSRWMLAILEQLSSPRRFCAIQAALCGLSRGVLAAQLGELLQMGLIHQESYPCFPPRVEYSLTRKGQSFLEIIHTFHT
jgi:DNA-binding HxlR family transcriptional regulator